MTARVTQDAGDTREFEVVVRLDSPIEVTYYRHGGVLPYVLRRWTAHSDADERSLA